jgi:hypothetical protein
MKEQIKQFKDELINGYNIPEEKLNQFIHLVNPAYEEVKRIIPNEKEINTLECPNLTILRRAGNTTRQVNFAIEMLMQGYTVIVRDHFKNGEVHKSNRRLFDLIYQRLSIENNIDYLIKERIINFNPNHLIIKFTKEF